MYFVERNNLIAEVRFNRLGERADERVFFYNESREARAYIFDDTVVVLLGNGYACVIRRLFILFVCYRKLSFVRRTRPISRRSTRYTKID